uniref:Uncharacterized protein n=1 Tax=Aegilops tauschii subsp. strangulata TaxID=200361 RepID=A0A452XM98_AEGTS
MVLLEFFEDICCILSHQNNQISLCEYLSSESNCRCLARLMRYALMFCGV